MEAARRSNSQIFRDRFISGRRGIRGSKTTPTTSTGTFVTVKPYGSVLDTGINGNGGAGGVVVDDAAFHYEDDAANGGDVF
jgi:hypothetical protein